MAGTLQLDFLQPQSNTGLYILSPTGSTMASMNTSGIYSATGSLLVANTGGGLTTSNLTASGTITGNTLTLTGNSLVVGSNTIIIPSTGGTAMVSGNMPAFSAYQSTAQSFTINVVTKVTCQTEEFDTNSNYDNATNYRFTPTIAGYYQVSACISVGTAAAQIGTYIYKNGSKYKQGSNYASGYTGSVSCLVYCNGSTDYIEFYGVFSITQNASANIYDTSFQAVMVRSA